MSESYKKKRIESEKEVRQNLVDAGCSVTSIEKFMDCYKCGDWGKGNKILDCYRKELLDEVHEGERKINCLDYLRFQIEKKTGKEK